MVYVDFDDVLCQTARSFIEVVEREFGRRYAFEDIHSFDLAKSFELNPREYELLMVLIHNPDLLRVMEPMPGVLDVLKRWNADGVEVVVVTGRPPATEPVCHDWLKQHSVAYNRIIFVDKYGRAHEPVANVEVLSPHDLVGLDFCLAVEDAPAMIRFLVEETTIPVAVLDRPWNRSLELAVTPTDHQLTRCEDWNAVAEHVTLRARCSA